MDCLSLVSFAERKELAIDMVLSDICGQPANIADSIPNAVAVAAEWYAIPNDIEDMQRIAAAISEHICLRRKTAINLN